MMTGCMKQPDIPTYTVTEGSTIGYLVRVKPYPMHTHVGTTAFNNFSKEYKYDWEVQSYIENSLAQNMPKTKNLKLINLAKQGFVLEDLKNLIIASNSKWVVNPEKKTTYERLAKLRLSAVIVINDGAKMASLECGAFGCTEHYARGYGLYTRSILGLDSYAVATAFYTKVYLMQPPADMRTKFETPYGTQMPVLKTPFTSKEDERKMEFIEPKDFNNLSEKELVLFEKSAKEYIDTNAKNIGIELNH